MWVVIACAGNLACARPEGRETDDGTDSSTSSESGETDELLPDLDAPMTAMFVRDSLWTTTETFVDDHCAVVEGCLEHAGERRLLRFSAYIPNIGTADFVIGSPQLDPTSFEWSPCHEHWHFSNFAEYRLLDNAGNVAALGHKMAFALMDTAPWVVDAGSSLYPLANGVQGISVGWVDVYLSHLDCQWIDITGVPAGDYQLEISFNPAARVPERDHANNTLVLPIALTSIDSGPPGIPDTWSCAEVAYGANDVCECGCGAFDPDCSNPTVTACEACNEPGSCADGHDDCAAIVPNNNAICQ